MPEWLDRVFESDVDTSLTTIIGRQLIALGLGVVVGFIYRWTVNGAPGGVGARPRAEMVATLVLLTVLISMMTAVIGDNIARAFSIVGALSIVRFRTVVEDTRDTAFVICAVAVGMAAGAGHILLPLVTLPIVAIVAMLFRPAVIRGAPKEAFADTPIQLTVRTGSGHSMDSAVRAAMEPHVRAISILAIESARQGAALETTYDARLQSFDRAHALVEALNAVEGVQSVELRRA